jgi:hypothetical protein
LLVWRTIPVSILGADPIQTHRLPQPKAWLGSARTISDPNVDSGVIDLELIAFVDYPPVRCTEKSA